MEERERQPKRYMKQEYVEGETEKAAEIFRERKNNMKEEGGGFSKRNYEIAITNDMFFAVGLDLINDPDLFSHKRVFSHKGGVLTRALPYIYIYIIL